ncbi:hypothetical protein FOXB_08945 [Fusarium oxysporum f. sp. conglutinans Fo5176]|uniref:Uncharacterized protein n=1 Tax=Fusarium oxysporum (strain Fo5176) TaxID=660025 RepID=F9FRB5_FUSOF|nr:hypothetical protein FOXB_08945 [Fusarium oxysporum f. sp. conglutinans Fo5176]
MYWSLEEKSSGVREMRDSATRLVHLLIHDSIVLKGGYLDREAPALSAAGLLGTCGSFSAVVPPPVEFANDKLQHVAISRATATERHTAK